MSAVARLPAIRRGAIAMTITHAALSTVTLIAAADVSPDDAATAFRYFGAANAAATLAVALVAAIAATTIRRSTLVAPAGAALAVAFVLGVLAAAQGSGATLLFLAVVLVAIDVWLYAGAVRGANEARSHDAPVAS